MYRRGLENWRIVLWFPAGLWYFSFPQNVQNRSGAHGTSLSVSIRNFSVGIKRLLREADHLPTSSTEVNSGWSYASISPYAFLACTWGNFTFTFTFIQQRWRCVCLITRSAVVSYVVNEYTVFDFRHYHASFNSSICVWIIISHLCRFILFSAVSPNLKTESAQRQASVSNSGVPVPSPVV
jgi:hypothetical protein